jgi:hypothetical protein
VNFSWLTDPASDLAGRHHTLQGMTHCGGWFWIGAALVQSEFVRRLTSRRKINPNSSATDSGLGFGLQDEILSQPRHIHFHDGVEKTKIIVPNARPTAAGGSLLEVGG